MQLLFARLKIENVLFNTILHKIFKTLINKSIGVLLLKMYSTSKTSHTAATV